jgi:hypothetical protein
MPVATVGEMDQGVLAVTAFQIQVLSSIHVASVEGTISAASALSQSGEPVTKGSWIKSSHNGEWIKYSMSSMTLILVLTK